MPGNGHQLGQPDRPTEPAEVLGDGVRGWIERVIVPILVAQYVREKELQEEQTDG